MITKEHLNNRYDEIEKSINTLDRELDDIWEAAMAKNLNEVCRLSDHIRYLGHQCLGMTKQKIEFLLDDIEKVLEENEKTKDLPRLLDYQMAFDQIQATVKRWDKQLNPENHPSE